MAVRSAAMKWLEREQERLYKRIGRLKAIQEQNRLTLNPGTDFINTVVQTYATGPHTEQELVELRANLEAAIRKGLSSTELPTRYQNPATYAILLHLAEGIEESVKQLSLPLSQKPLLGTLPTGRVNAMAVAVRGSNEYLVLFDDQVFIFALLLSKAVARAFPITPTDSGMVQFSGEDKDWKRNLSENPIVLRRFQEVLLAYLFAGDPAVAPQYFLEEPYFTLSGILRDSMECFIMGHEYGHIIEGHLANRSTAAALLGNDKVQEYVRSWEQEFDADAVGASLVIDAMRRQRHFDVALSFWGADFFFSCIEIVERGVSIVKTGQENQLTFGSHPPVALRREALRNALAKSLPEEHAKAAVTLGRTLEQIIEELWSITKPHLLALHNQHQALAAVWG